MFALDNTKIVSMPPIVLWFMYMYTIHITYIYFYIYLNDTKVGGGHL